MARVLGSALCFMAVAGGATAQESGECRLAVKLLSARLPELSETATGYAWRSIPTTFTCDADGTVGSVALRWAEGQGLLSDARSASAAFGSRITGDTATAVRDAFDRCIVQASRSAGETITVTTGRTLLTCTANEAATLIAVGRRTDR